MAAPASACEHAPQQHALEIALAWVGEGGEVARHAAVSREWRAAVRGALPDARRLLLRPRGCCAVAGAAEVLASLGASLGAAAAARSVREAFQRLRTLEVDAGRARGCGYDLSAGAVAMVLSHCFAGGVLSRLEELHLRGMGGDVYGGCSCLEAVLAAARQRGAPLARLKALGVESVAGGSSGRWRSWPRHSKAARSSQ